MIQKENLKKVVNDMGCDKWVDIATLHPYTKEINVKHDPEDGYYWGIKTKGFASITFSGKGNYVKFYKTLAGCKRNLLNRLGFSKEEIKEALR
jgi:hypothetical protein